MKSTKAAIKPATTHGTILAERLVPLIPWISVVYLTILLVFSIPKGPQLNYDSATGFHTWSSSEKSGRWNQVSEMKSLDVSKDTSAFVAAFSPGQYAVPVAVHRAGVPIGSAIIITVWIFSISAVVGFWWLLQVLKFSNETIVFSCLLLLFSRTVSYPFWVYNGGEVLLLGAFPWVIGATYLLWRNQSLAALWTIPVFIAGSFLKLTASLLSLSCAIASVLNQIYSQREGGMESPMLALKTRWKQILTPIGCFVVAQVLIQIFYLNRGWTAVTAGSDSGVSEGPRSFLANILMTFAALLVGPFSAGDLADFVIFQPRLLRHVILENRVVVCLVGIIAVLAGIALYDVLRSKLTASIKANLAGTVLVFVPICLYIFSFGSSWFEERHLRIPGLLLLATLFELSRSERRVKLQFVLLCCLLGSSAYGFASWGRHWLKSDEQTVSSTTGIRFQSISPAALKLLHKLQNEMPPDFLFVSLDPGLALESPKHRFGLVNGTESAFESLRKMKGKVSEALLILPASSIPVDDLSKSWQIGDSELNCKFQLETDFVFATQSVCKSVESALASELRR